MLCKRAENTQMKTHRQVHGRPVVLLEVVLPGGGARPGRRGPPRGSFCESFTHSRYIWVKNIGRLRGSRTRGCANEAPTATPPPTEAREGCSQLWPCGRRLCKKNYRPEGRKYDSPQ